MKKILLLCFFNITTSIFAQEEISLEKSITGIQVGLFGAYVYNETKIAEKWVLRSQFTLNSSIFGGNLYSNNGFALTPSLSVASKYYYNINKRSEQGKNIKNNAANYVSLKVDYFPNWFVISNVKNLEVNDGIFLTPNYGIRRNFAKNFNYEFRAGLGFGTLFKGNYGLQTRLDLSLKVGYDF